MQPPNQQDTEQPQPDQPVEVASDSPTPAPEAPVTSPTTTPEPASSAAAVPGATLPKATTSIPQGAGPAKSKKKMLLVGGIIAAVVVLGGGIAFASWYQSPDKVLLDSLVNTSKAKQAGLTGTTTIETKDVDVSVNLASKSSQETGSIKADVTLKLKSGQFADEEFKVTADAIAVKKDEVYFKISNLEKALDSFVSSFAESYADQYRKMGYPITDAEVGQLRTQLKAQFQGVVGKIDDQWIKMSADDLKDDSDESTCVTDAFAKISTDQKLATEILDVYKQHRFLTIKQHLGTKDGSFGYLLDLDEDAAKKFGEGVESTEFGKELVKCDSDMFKKSDSSSKKSDDSLKNGRFELWVDEWSHRITRVVFRGESSDTATTQMKLSGELKLDYNVKLDDIKAPEGAKSIKEIEADIKALTGSASMLSSET